MQKAPESQIPPTGRSAGLVVSIHDVSPLTRERTAGILADLRAAGVATTSLLVIPDHHHRGRISADPAFGTWLRECCASGHEAVLHGYHHLRPQRDADTFWKRMVTQTYTAGEGEFFDLREEEASRLLAAGRRELEACGVKPSGFIAPAWLLGEAAETAVRQAGFGYTTRIAAVRDFRTGIDHPSRSLVWSVRAAWRRSCSLFWNAALAQATRIDPLMRIGIHPPDWEFPAVRTQILQIVGKALAARVPMTYEGWLRVRSTAAQNP